MYANGTGGAVTKYSTPAHKSEQLANAHNYIEAEPRNSMMIFAKPEVKGTQEGEKTIPTEQSGRMLTVEPGEFPHSIPEGTEIIYLKQGSHWMGSKRQADFPASVRWVYFEPGAYLKGALNFAGNRNVTQITKLRDTAFFRRNSMAMKRRPLTVLRIVQIPIQIAGILVSSLCSLHQNLSSKSLIFKA